VTCLNRNMTLDGGQMWCRPDSQRFAGLAMGFPPLQVSLGRLGGGERPVRKIYDASSPRELPQQLCLLAGEMRSASVASESLEQEPDAVLTNRSLTTCRVVRWRWTPACVPLRQARRERRPIARRLDQWRPSSACRAAGVKAVWFTLRPCSPHAPLVCGKLECNARSAGASHPRGTCLCASSVAALICRSWQHHQLLLFL
jgi:hypothetical protein